MALRNITEFKSGNRKIEECIPEPLEQGEIYNFLKKDQRNYYLAGEIPLLETEGNSILLKPIASIIILEATHFIDGGGIFTKGKYKVVKIIAKDEIYFNGFNFAR